MGSLFLDPKQKVQPKYEFRGASRRFACNVLSVPKLEALEVAAFQLQALVVANHRQAIGKGVPCRCAHEHSRCNVSPGLTMEHLDCVGLQWQLRQAIKRSASVRAPSTDKWVRNSLFTPPCGLFLQKWMRQCLKHVTLVSAKNRWGNHASL